jgi:hypothetical protein
MRQEVFNMADSSENGPEALQGKHARKPLRKALQVQVFQEDYWMCRYSGRPVISRQP